MANNSLSDCQALRRPALGCRTPHVHCVYGVPRKYGFAVAADYASSEIALILSACLLKCNIQHERILIKSKIICDFVYEYDEMIRGDIKKRRFPALAVLEISNIYSFK